MPWERAHALLRHGRCLLGLGRPAEARETLHAAREIFASLGATSALTETDKWAGPGDRADRIADPSPGGATTTGGWRFMTVPCPPSRRYSAPGAEVGLLTPSRWMRLNPGGCLHAGARGTTPAKRTGRTGWPLPTPPGTR
jgi:hypothetical protein